MTLSRTAIAAAVALTVSSAAALARDNSYVDATTIRQVQETLHNRGFRAGQVDGVMGPATRDALKQFQQSENLETTDLISATDHGAVAAHVPLAAGALAVLLVIAPGALRAELSGAPR